MQDHPRRGLPRTRYVTASPETWSLIRGAYLSGMSAPAVAARFGVSETSIRRRAGREGWTKAAFAAAPRTPLATPTRSLRDHPPRVGGRVGVQRKQNRNISA